MSDCQDSQLSRLDNTPIVPAPHVLIEKQWEPKILLLHTFSPSFFYQKLLLKQIEQNQFINYHISNKDTDYRMLQQHPIQYPKKLNLQIQMVQQKSAIFKGRIFALFILLFEIGIIIAYGFGAQFLRQTETGVVTDGIAYLDHSDIIILYVCSAILAILGYGLLIAYSHNSAVAGLTTTLIVISISVQLGPLVLSFWEYVFNGFSSLAVVSLGKERQTMVLCTSLLVSLTGLIGKLGIIQIFITTITYNIGWSLSIKASQYVYNTYGPTSPPAFDDNGTNYVYVFAGFFSIITSLIINCKKGKMLNQGSRHSVFIAMIGTGFIFATFPFTGILFPSSASNNPYRRMQSPLNIYFALTASVIFTYVSSTIFGRYKIGVRQSMIGILSGGVTISVVSGSVINIGACIAIGAFSGLVSGFWLQYIHPRINKNSSIDHIGLLGPILICSIFGGLVLAPVLYSAYKQNMVVTKSFDVMVTDYRTSSYEVGYIAIAAGTAIVTAIITGLLNLLFRDQTTDFDYKKVVSSDFGLYKPDNAYIERQGINTNTQLKNVQI